MEKIVNLKSRHFKNYLKKLEAVSGKESSTYILKVEHPIINVDEDGGKIITIDPMGGPRIKVGHTVENIGEVEFIDYVLGSGYVITFK